MVVGGVARGAGDLQDAVAAGQRLADVRAVPDMGGAWVRLSLRHDGALRERRRKGRREGRARAPAFPPRRASSARTTIRCASSILKALSPEGFASASAASAARRKAAASGAGARQHRLRPRGRATAWRRRRRARAAPRGSCRRSMSQRRRRPRRPRRRRRCARGPSDSAHAPRSARASAGRRSATISSPGSSTLSRSGVSPGRR